MGNVKSIAHYKQGEYKMLINQEFEYEIKFDELDTESTIIVEVWVDTFTPERPAPCCSNPDSPSFSDSGDSEEIEFEILAVIVGDEEHKITLELEEKLSDILYSKIVDSTVQFLIDGYDDTDL